jgi:hypothetical protein
MHHRLRQATGIGSHYSQPHADEIRTSHKPLGITTLPTIYFPVKKKKKKKKKKDDPDHGSD